MAATLLVILQIVFWLCLSATLYTYLLYPLLLMVARKLRRPRPYTPRDTEASVGAALPTVTMVVSAYNEEDTLPDKIANCRALDYPHGKLTFLFGSDGSTDATNHVLRTTADERFRVIVNDQRCGKVGMLNQLVPHVHAEIIVFSDANTMYEPQAVRMLVQALQGEKVGGAIGKLILSAGGNRRACRTEGLYWRYENFVKSLESDLGILSTVNGGVFAIWRELFTPLPEHALTEDQVLGMKIMTRGYRCVFAAHARAHETVSTWAGELRRRIRISAGNFQSLALVPRILDPRIGGVSFAFVSHKLLRWLAPFFLLGMLTASLLLRRDALYGGALLAQGVFYAAGLAGAALPALSGILRVLAIPRYFLAMNLAILIGLARCLRRRQRVTWAKAPR